MADQSPFDDLLRQVQRLQSDVTAAQDALAEETIEASVGGGAVTAVVRGTGELVRVRLDPSVVDPDDVEMLEDLVVAAVHEAMREAAARRESAVGGAMGGLDLGGLGLDGLLGSGGGPDADTDDAGSS